MRIYSNCTHFMGESLFLSISETILPVSEIEGNEVIENVPKIEYYF